MEEEEDSGRAERARRVGDWERQEEEAVGAGAAGPRIDERGGVSAYMAKIAPFFFVTGMVDEDRQEWIDGV